jgi:NAD(P)-dependent dehydrogenase (short-subunit alcohol dehydrogenase family)
MSEKIKIAVWGTTEKLYHQVMKLNEKDYEIVAFFSDDCLEENKTITVKRRKEISKTEFDFLIISYDNFRRTREELSEEFGITENVYTFEEFWVRDCEKIIVEKYHSLWRKRKMCCAQFYTGKTVLITGGSGGIGRECALAFAYAGAKVVIAGRSEKRLQETCSEIEKIGMCKYIVWDIKNINEYEKKLTQANALYSSEIDVLVNAAGLWDRDNKDFFSVTVEEYDEILDTNLKGTYFMCQLIAKYFIKKKRAGNIVNVISNVGTIPTVKPYGVSKWGVVGLTKGLGMALAEYGIIVNGIAPGEVATSMAGWKKGDCPARRAHKNGRLSFPCEVAETILHLAGFMGENMIGEVIVCDGGDKTVNIRL